MKKIAIGQILCLFFFPSLAHASFLPPDLIDGFANILSWIVLIVMPIGLIAAPSPQFEPAPYLSQERPPFALMIRRQSKAEESKLKNNGQLGLLSWA
jgi:hypothetical protein